MILEHTAPARLAVCLIDHGASHRNASVRRTCSHFAYRCLERMGAQSALENRQFMEKVCNNCIWLYSLKHCLRIIWLAPIKCLFLFTKTYFTLREFYIHCDNYFHHMGYEPSKQLQFPPVPYYGTTSFGRITESKWTINRTCVMFIV